MELDERGKINEWLNTADKRFNKENIKKCNKEFRK